MMGRREMKIRTRRIMKMKIREKMRRKMERRRLGLKARVKWKDAAQSWL